MLLYRICKNKQIVCFWQNPANLKCNTELVIPNRVLISYVNRITENCIQKVVHFIQKNLFFQDEVVTHPVKSASGKSGHIRSNYDARHADADRQLVLPATSGMEVGLRPLCIIRVHIRYGFFDQQCRDRLRQIQVPSQTFSCFTFYCRKLKLPSLTKAYVFYVRYTSLHNRLRYISKTNM